MPSTIEQAKDAMLKHEGGASKHQIARELKISLDYASLILGELMGKGEVILSSGLYILTSLKKGDLQDTREERPVRKSRKQIYPLVSVLGISEPLARILTKAGYTTPESLADAPISMLMGSTKLKLKEAAQLINHARGKIIKVENRRDHEVA